MTPAEAAPRAVPAAVAGTAPVGLYVHVPYCRSICPYCDFNVYRAGRAPPYAALIEALAAEVRARAQAFRGPLRSVYFGGGTPSLAPPELVSAVLEAASEHWAPAGLEVTLEADPGTLDGPGLSAFRAAGVNRLSIGWQSSHDALLKRLGRQHDGAAGDRAVAMARAAGFENVSLDLMVAVPGQTLEHLRQDLDRLLALSPEHVSLYAMTYHAGTPMARRVASGRLRAVDEDVELAMMAAVQSRLGPHGYGRYEISNYARPGRASRHNRLYWQGGQYLGVGPGAHSFLRDGWRQGWRWAALKRPEAYIAAWPEGAQAQTPPLAEAVDFVEALGPEALRLERIMLGLRQPSPLRLGAILAEAERAGAKPLLTAAAAVQALLAHGWAVRAEDGLLPTALGLDHSDAAAALFA